ncbi:MAG: serine protease [Chlamydiales bacterium]|nr:serine protease [Chlamydiales bacterium]
MKKYFAFITLLFSLLLSPLYCNSEDVSSNLEEVSKAIVRVFCTANVYNFDSPWQPPFQVEYTGSASILEGGYVLTNAHVVAGGVSIYLKREDNVNLFPAKILRIEHDYDLALLQVEDPDFLNGVMPLEIGEMPRPRDEIYTLGYPTGGEKLSVTRGVVSRTEIQSSVHSGMKSMFTQIDASINPGNSGGAVVREGKLVGVATQGISYAQNIGYMVPQITVERFIKTFYENKPSSLPSLDVLIQDFRNPDLRKFVGLDKDQGGILITEVLDSSVAKGILQKFDVVLSIDGYKLESDNSYEWRKGERISAINLIKTHLIGEPIKLKIYRDGEILDKEIILSNTINDARLVTHRTFGTPPSYFIFGSLVFQPLNENYLGIWGEDWISNAPNDLINHFLDGEKSQEKDQVVLLSRILPHKSNIGYGDMGRGMVVEKLNGVKIKNLKHLKGLLEKHSDPYIHLELQSHSRITLKTETIKQSHEEVMRVYGIYNDHSEDLE